MARRPKQHGLPVAVIDNTLLTRLVNLEIAQFLPLLFKLQRFANGCASHLSFRGGLLPSGPTRTGGHSPPLNGHTQAQTAIVLIPPEVKREAYKAPHKGKRRLRKLVREMAGFFVDCYEADVFTKDFLKADFGEGEAAAIAQADYRKAVLLLDEKDGYERAKVMRLTTIRTVNLLNMLKEAGMISEVKPYYQKLEDTGFYLKAEVRRQLLAEAGEEE